MPAVRIERPRVTGRSYGYPIEKPNNPVAPPKGFVGPPMPAELLPMAVRATSSVIFATKPLVGEAETMPALINPDTFQERLGANYSLGNVLGLSHQSIQYTHTESRTIPMELQISELVLVQKGWAGRVTDLMQWKKFFQSLVVPTVLGLAPPQIKIVWPEAKLAFTGVVRSVEVTYESFAPTGRPMAYVISLEFLEVARRLMTSSRVRAHGVGEKAVGD